MFYRNKLKKLHRFEFIESLNNAYLNYAKENINEGEFFYPQICKQIDEDILEVLVKGSSSARFTKDKVYGFIVWYFKK